MTWGYNKIRHIMILMYSYKRTWIGSDFRFGGWSNRGRLICCIFVKCVITIYNSRYKQVYKNMQAYRLQNNESKQFKTKLLPALQVTVMASKSALKPAIPPCFQ